MRKKENENTGLSITKEEFRLIKDNVDVDYIEQYPEDVYEMIQRLCTEVEYLYSRLECALEQIKPYNDLCLYLNKENKKLSKELNKYKEKENE